MKFPGLRLPNLQKRDPARRDGVRAPAGNRPRGRTQFNLRGRLLLVVGTLAPVSVIAVRSSRCARYWMRRSMLRASSRPG